MFSTLTTTVVPPMDLSPKLSNVSEVSENDICKIIKHSPTKSCLLDPVPNFLLKDCVDILLPSITKFVNLSLIEGVFPQQFKKVVAIPLIKKELLSSIRFMFYVKIGGAGCCQTVYATHQ